MKLQITFKTKDDNNVDTNTVINEINKHYASYEECIDDIKYWSCCVYEYMIITGENYNSYEIMKYYKYDKWLDNINNIISSLYLINAVIVSGSPKKVVVYNSYIEIIS